MFDHKATFLFIVEKDKTKFHQNVKSFQKTFFGGFWTKNGFFLNDNLQLINFLLPWRLSFSGFDQKLFFFDFLKKGALVLTEHLVFALL